MKAAAVAAVVLTTALAACSASNTAPVATTTSAATNSVVTTPVVTAPVGTAAPSTAAPSTTPTHTPLWLTVKYRSDPVDVADPGFVALDGGSSSLVDAAFYDASNEYMIVSLNGTTYHYCGMPDGAWSQFVAASSLGSFYEEQIKGRYDCRTAVVPEY